MLELLVRVNTDREFYRHTARIFRGAAIGWPYAKCIAHIVHRQFMDKTGETIVFPFRGAEYS